MMSAGTTSQIIKVWKNHYPAVISKLNFWDEIFFFVFCFGPDNCLVPPGSKTSPEIIFINAHDTIRRHWVELLWLIEAQWRHLATYSWVNIGSGNGLLPDGTKPLPEPMLTYHQ